MNVDMATYKAEFLSHYYEGRLRPRHRLRVGLIHWWARLASLAPGRGQRDHAARRSSARLIKCIGGISTAADDARVRPRDFKAWFRRRPPQNVRPAATVLLWPDTFNNYFHPQTAKRRGRGAGGGRASRWRPAAVALLRPAALRLRHARHGQAATSARSSTPSAADRGGHPRRRPGAELRGRLPRRADQPLPRRSSTPAALATRPSCSANSSSNAPPTSSAADSTGKTSSTATATTTPLMGMKDEMRSCARTGLDVQLLDSGCCGMAGPFGFEEDKYEVSQTLGERVLLPAVREADERR